MTAPDPLVCLNSRAAGGDTTCGEPESAHCENGCEMCPGTCTCKPSAENARHLWSAIDWTLWGHGLNDVAREPIATAMVNAIPADDIDRIVPVMLAWKARRGWPALHEEYAKLRDEIQRLQKQLDDLGAHQTEHIIDIKPDGWTIKHPLSCRPQLFDCPVHQAAQRRDFATVHPKPGRYNVALDAAGWVLIGEPVEAQS